MVQILDKYGNTSTDEGRVLILDKYGNIKKVSSGGGSPTGPAGGDLSGTYPNPSVTWANGEIVYDGRYYPLPTGTTSQYIRGNGTLATFPTIPTITPSALTKTDDTNVTITLGGTPSTALLQAVSLTLGWTGTLADSRIASASTWNAKQNAITTGTTSQYFRGDLSLATFPTIPTVGTWGALNYPTWTSGTPFVKMTAAGTFTLDTTIYYPNSNPSGFTSNTGTVTSVAALTLGTSGTDLSSTVANGTTTPVITLNVPTASATNRGALSATDWSTFNGKQNALGFTPYKFINTTQLTVSGTLSETIGATATIPGSTFLANDIMKVTYRMIKSTTLQQVVMRIRINTTNTLTGSFVLATYNMAIAVTGGTIQRHFTLNGGLVYGLNPGTTGQVTDIAALSAATGQFGSYNTANTLYMFFTIQLGDVLDTAIFNMANITN